VDKFVYYGQAKTCSAMRSACAAFNLTEPFEDQFSLISWNARTRICYDYFECPS
jgi:hypothetical protein